MSFIATHFIDQSLNKGDDDDLLAGYMKGLSTEERETVVREMYRVGPVVEESEDLIQLSLDKLEYELYLIPSSDKTAYEKALHRGQPYQEYVSSREFRLMFLRCEDFDTKKAAKRLVLYFDGMLQHFGPQVLGRSLLYTDLHPDSQAYLRTGGYPIAGDAVGRSVKVCHALMNSSFYLNRPQQLCAVEHDAATQQRGIIAVYFFAGKVGEEFNHKDLAHVAEAQQNWFPVKVSALHICFNDSAFSCVQSLVWLALGSKVDKRARLHYGSYAECMHEVVNCGIRLDDAFPIQDQGALPEDIHRTRLSLRQAKEEHIMMLMKMDIIEQKEERHRHLAYHDVDTSSRSPAFTTDTNPGMIEKLAPNDVALWRGRGFQKHSGNIRMRDLIEERREVYDEAPTGYKNQVSKEIVQIIRNEFGGRFLTRDSSGFWVETSDKEAERRVSKSFRSARSSAKKKVQSSKTDLIHSFDAR